MPRSPAPNWRQRKQPVLDQYIKASIDAAGGKYDPDTGWYGTLHYTGCGTRDRAKEIVQALHRSAYYMCTHNIADVGANCKIIKARDGTYTVEFRASNKAHARAAVIAKYGEDRSKWPYNPRAKGSQ
jgi:hypothetical protein